MTTLTRNDWLDDDLHCAICGTEEGDLLDVPRTSAILCRHCLSQVAERVRGADLWDGVALVARGRKRHAGAAE